MRKLFLILPVILLFSSRAFPQAEIAFDCPVSWGPGRYTKITVNISFAQSEGFARFTQDLPVGFEIVKDEIPEGDFSWNGSQLNVVWMSIPRIKRVRFSYFIKPDDQMQGMIELGGRVVTILGSTSRTISPVKEMQISIGGTAGLLPEEMKKDITPHIVTNVTNNGSKPLQSATSGTLYRVQVSISAEEISVDAMKKKLGIVSNEKMIVIKSGEIFKYQLGEFTDKSTAVRLQEQLVSNGVKDAFVVTGR